MAWTTPRTWSPNETETAAIFNQALRDNLNFIYTLRQPLQSYRTMRCLQAVAFNSSWTNGVNQNSAGGGDTQLTGYNYTAPIGIWKNPGDAILAIGTGYVPGSASETKTFKVQVGTGSKFTLHSANFSSAAVVHYRLCFVRNSSTNVGIWGYIYWGSTGTSFNGPRIISGSFTVANLDSNTQAFAWYTASNTAGQLGMTDHNLYQCMGIEGAVV